MKRALTAITLVISIMLPVVAMNGNDKSTHYDGPEQQYKESAFSSDDQKVYTEEAPEFPGGQEALFNFLRTNLRYPKQAQKNGIQGRIVVQFVVEKDGSVNNIRVIRGVDPDLDKEAIRIVGLLPKWKPGKNNGSPVRCYYTIPINFRLQQ